MTQEIPFDGPTHHVRRNDAVWHNGRRYVPTEQFIKWVSNWQEFREAHGITHFNEDQTELVLTLPEGYKFSVQFQKDPP